MLCCHEGRVTEAALACGKATSLRRVMSRQRLIAAWGFSGDGNEALTDDKRKRA